MNLDSRHANRCTFLMSLVVIATLFIATGCSVRMPRQQTVAPPSPAVESLPAVLPTATAQPSPTAVPPTPAVTPTPQDVTDQLLADGAMTLATGDLFATNPTSASLLTMQYPNQGLLREQPRKQSGTTDEQNPFLILFPELRRAAAPAWLKEGVRVTYRFESASIAQKEGAEGSSGAGFAQYDLVALDRQAAVTSVRMYTDLGTGTLLPSMVMRFVGLPGAGEYWVNPKVLQDAESVANDNLAVLRMPQKAGGKTYQSVRFVYNTEGAEYVWAFDQSTGLLLFYRHAIGDDDDTHKQLTQITFVKQRQLKVPWRATAAPAWASEGSRMEYKGTYALLLPDTPPTSLPYTLAAQVTRSEGRWTEFQVDAALQQQVPNKSVRASGVAQLFDGLWLPADAIKKLKNGQVLDRDAVTRTEVSVSRGRNTVSLTETGESHRVVLTYNSDGVLTGIRQETQNGIGTIQIELTLVKRG